MISSYADLTGGDDLMPGLVELHAAGFRLERYHIGHGITQYVLAGPGYSGNSQRLHDLIGRALRFARQDQPPN